MAVADQIQSLLYSCKSIVDRHEWLSEKHGDRFNIFEILDRTTDEVKGHSAFLGELLDSNGTHGQGSLFQIAFLQLLESLQLPDDNFREWMDGSQNWKTLIEFPIPQRFDGIDNGSGRIDLLIEGDDASIIIENKIYAPDQPEQLERYWKFAKSINKPCLLVYLTPNGEAPSTTSLGSLSVDQILCLSYRCDIADWIQRSVELTAQLPHIRETLGQYHRLIREISTGIPQEEMIMEIANLLTDPSLFQAACEVERALPHAKSRLQLKFWSQLEAQLSEQSEDCSREAIEGNELTEKRVEAMCFKGRNSQPFGLSIPCGTFENGVELRFVFEIWEHFYYGLAICRDNVRLKLQSDTNATQLLNELIKMDPEYTAEVKGDDQTLYKFTDPRLDWKNFSGHCADLAYEDRLQETVQKIVGDFQAMNGYLNQIAAKFGLTIKQSS